jgi:hypothetical protein
MNDKYKIIRFFQTDEVGEKIIATGLTREEAKAHCSDPETSSDTCKLPENKQRTRVHGKWFDSFAKEKQHV